jgi:K+:H+ antiporter
MFSAANDITLTFIPATAAEGKASYAAEHLVTVFLAELLLLLLTGRLIGELMARAGQPSVMGQLLAGVLLGPSVFGSLWPSAYQVVFPHLPEQKEMIDAISQLGILLLLLLTGMEMDWALVKRARRAAFFSSLSGIIFPFACGLALGYLLPDSMLPEPDRRCATALFLATALAISSVKIVAMVIREAGFLSHSIGQIIVTSAIIDDTIGWIIIALIGGLAAHGKLEIAALSFTSSGIFLFLALV